MSDFSKQVEVLTLDIRFKNYDYDEAWVLILGETKAPELRHHDELG